MLFPRYYKNRARSTSKQSSFFPPPTLLGELSPTLGLKSVLGTKGVLQHQSNTRSAPQRAGTDGFRVKPHTFAGRTQDLGSHMVTPDRCITAPFFFQLFHEPRWLTVTVGWKLKDRHYSSLEKRSVWLTLQTPGFWEDTLRFICHIVSVICISGPLLGSLLVR